MIHILLKASKRIKTNFNIPKVTSEVKIPQESLDFAKEYQASDKYAEEYDKDLALVFDEQIVFGFDYLDNGKKLIIPEINPILIFYSNAIMSHKQIDKYRGILLKNSQDVKRIKGAVDPAYFGDFFQLAINFIVNLQGTIESFLNYSIPEDYVFLSVNNREIRRPNIHDKIDIAITELCNKSFEEYDLEKYLLIKDLIQLRNDIIHLKPIEGETNTKYKKLFRRVLDLDYDKTVIAT